MIFDALLGFCVVVTFHQLIYSLFQNDKMINENAFCVGVRKVSFSRVFSICHYCNTVNCERPHAACRIAGTAVERGREPRARCQFRERAHFMSHNFAHRHTAPLDGSWRENVIRSTVDHPQVHNHPRSPRSVV